MVTMEGQPRTPELVVADSIIVVQFGRRLPPDLLEQQLYIVLCGLLLLVKRGSP